jgi:enamine deaminase RidA (YjgF/YER057c/UK114 family)
MAHGSKLAPESWQTRSMTATDATPEPLYNGVPYDYASVVSAQSIIFTAGACPLDSDGVVVGHDNLRAQANAAFDNLVLVLAQHGAGAEHLVRTTIYVVGVQADLVEVWNVVEARLAPYRPAWQRCRPPGPTPDRVAAGKMLPTSTDDPSATSSVRQ